MKVLALDLSLRCTGWAHNKGLTPAVGNIRSRSLVGTPRLQEVLDGVARLARDVELAVVEGYAYHAADRGVSQAHSLGELGGVIRLFFYQKKIPLIEIAPAQIKKLATGAGNADKAKVLIAAVKRLRYKGSDHNEADALWLLQAALTHYNLPGAVNLPSTHLDALTKIEWKKNAA